MNVLYIFDLDQTLVRPVEGLKVPNSIREQVIIPGVVEQCARFKELGAKLSIASNQGGVSLGICTLEEAQERVKHVANAIGAEHWMISIFHEQATRNMAYFHIPFVGTTSHPYYRKPAPGMLLHLMMQFRANAPDTWFIGDQESDREAARNAGVQFAWAMDFFGWS